MNQEQSFLETCAERQIESGHHLDADGVKNLKSFQTCGGRASSQRRGEGVSRIVRLLHFTRRIPFGETCGSFGDLTLSTSNLNAITKLPLNSFSS